MGDDINVLIDYLANKLPESNYLSESSDTEYKENVTKKLHPTVTSIKSVVSIEGQSDRRKFYT